MKTKHYELTEIEILAIRDALEYIWFNHWKEVQSHSPIFKKVKKANRVLLDQFKTDYANI